MKKLRTGIILFCLLAMLCGCGKAEETSSAPGDGAAGARSGKATAVSLSFRNCMDSTMLASLDGKAVTVSGYLSLLFPEGGSYAYLMSLPGQDAPFFLPNSNLLANTIAFSAPDGGSISYTSDLIQVTGTLEVGEGDDPGGYTSPFRIVNATTEKYAPNTDDASYDLMLAVSNNGLAEEINSMLSYLHFVCQWSHYRSYFTDSSGNQVLVNLYPGDVEAILTDNSENGYGNMCNEYYFDDLLSLIDSVSSTGLEDLKEIVRMGKDLEGNALDDLTKRACSYDEATDSYTQTRDKLLYEYWNRLYLRFGVWLSSWLEEPASAAVGEISAASNHVH